MNKKDRNYLLYLEDILESFEKIIEYSKDLNFTSFKKDRKTIDAVIRNFQVIGEATKNIPKEIKNKYSNIPWEEMYRFRNRIVHEYFGIDYEILWDIVSNHIPENKRELKKVIKELKK